MTYTTQGLMTAADMADMADLYDLNLAEREGQAEEEAMEEAHATHADQCRACQEEDGQRETTARVALGMDTARRELEKAVQEALKGHRGQMSRAATDILEAGLEASRKALRSI